MSLRLEILAALFGDFETIYTMRNCRAMKPYGLALVGKNVLVLRCAICSTIEIESEACDPRWEHHRGASLPDP
jgi:hypothetical protein